jgi:hypothetical protein
MVVVKPNVIRNFVNLNDGVDDALAMVGDISVLGIRHQRLSTMTLMACYTLRTSRPELEFDPTQVVVAGISGGAPLVAISAIPTRH